MAKVDIERLLDPLIVELRKRIQSVPPDEQLPARVYVILNLLDDCKPMAIGTLEIAKDYLLHVEPSDNRDHRTLAYIR
ncbi:MAG: hypothetical protein DRJ38_00245 [Thermoprotei archaeon]|nr:MAG: hypothetical protein DRJ38_00245 [Thermoprotei archaeon]